MTERELLEQAAKDVMAHQWSNTREAMDALTRLVDAAYRSEKMNSKAEYTYWLLVPVFVGVGSAIGYWLFHGL